MCKIIDVKKILFLMLCLSIQLVAFGQNSTNSTSIRNKVNSEEEICNDPDELPDFPGGDYALIKYLKKNIYFPLDVPDDVEGQVYVTFVVEKNGSVTNIKIAKSPHPSFSVEAIRVIKRMPKWIPGKKDGEIVRTKLVMPFVFSIHDLD